MTLRDTSDLRPLAHQLVGKIFSSRVLASALEQPVTIHVLPGANDLDCPSYDCDIDILDSLVRTITRKLGIKDFLVVEENGNKLSIFEQALTDLLDLRRYRGLASLLSNASAGPIEELITELTQRVRTKPYRTLATCSSDGATLATYYAGNPVNNVIVIILPCGMPVDLIEEWIFQLSKEYFVLTWETRGMFDHDPQFDSRPYDVNSQIKDLIAVMDHCNVGQAHVMGLCGGAAVALIALNQHPDRVRSLSLWHGDYQLGKESPRTLYQADLSALMSMAAVDRSTAKSLHEIFSQSPMFDKKTRYAHLILYPYANPELLYRYARLNNEIMNADVGYVLPSIVHPTLVVTSKDDSTAHSGGSLAVAKQIFHARLEVLEQGDHLSLFDADEYLVLLARSFVAETTGNMNLVR
jgi:pimeloyl-ACP methyl ester carboxylesterase